MGYRAFSALKLDKKVVFMIKNKIKPILPSLKEKKRYVVFSLISQKKIEKAVVFSEIIHHYKQCFGEIGLAQAGIQLVDYDEEKKTGILRIGHTHLNKTRYCFALMRKIHNQDMIIYTKGVSGTIKKSRAKFAT